METNVNVPMFVMTQEQINQITEISARKGAKAGVKAFKEELAKLEKKNKRAQNKVVQTKKMLSQYRRLKAKLSDEREFTEEEKIELRWKFLQDLMGNVGEIVSKSERTIQDVEKKRQEDLYCIYRIEKATEMYKEECEKSGSEESKRRYRELYMMYLDNREYSVQEISQIEKVSDKTVYKDLGIACGIVAVYLLGI